MPAKAPVANKASQEQMASLAHGIRQRRLSLGISTVVAAHSAGVSRVTWHRMESAEASVTMEAYISALEVLGLNLALQSSGKAIRQGAPTVPLALDADTYARIPARIQIGDYPQLRQVAWHVKDGFNLTPAEAFGLYERNRRHLDIPHMDAQELALFRALEQQSLKTPHAV